jgi:hypothetical protein
MVLSPKPEIIESSVDRYVGVVMTIFVLLADPTVIR